MLLQELAEVSGTSAASIKYYRREGLLPAGARITATRQEYGPAHVERLQLIQVLRELADTSIADIGRLTAILDDPERPLIDALEVAQAIASGLPAERHGRPVPADEHPGVAVLIGRLGWPDVPSGPRAALDELLRTLEEWRIPVGDDVLLAYAEPMEALATRGLEMMRRADAGSSAPSADVMVSRAVAGMVAYDRLLRSLRALALASLSVKQQ